MADQVYMVYYQLMQESVNFTIETDPTGKKQLDRELLLCGGFLTFFYKRQYQDFKDFHHQPHPHPLQQWLGQPKYKVSGTR